MTRRILLVEDEEHLAFGLEFNLKAERYEVEVAFDLAQARAALERPHDLVILDVMLPDGDGFTFCEQLRGRGDLSPVLFLTAKGAPEDVVAGLAAGGDDYLVKPFVLQELLGRVSAMLRRRQWDERSTAEPAPVCRFGRNVVDLAAREARADGRVVPLTDLEFRLLRFFFENPRRVLAREELLEKVWEVSGASNTRTVDIFLVRLRKVFEEDPARPRHFQTVRGVGYRFVP